MAFFALALGFHLLHAAEPEVQVARLNTAELYRALDIEAHQAYADLMRFAHNLRLAYELRAYLAEREAEATSKPAPEVKGKGNSAGKPLACPLATAKPGF
ncbi:MAG: hypothetical protein HYY26_00955 [Acidobacteria bacterium]|nr:hypothetical protein [Acidobacteriota bacterium]